MKIQYRTITKWNYSYYTRNNPCPICNGKRNDCRKNEITKQIHCRTSPYQASTTEYQTFKQDKYGFNIWRKDKPKTNQSQTNHQEKTINLKIQAVNLPIEMRNLEIRKLLDQLELEERDYQHLRDRGFSETDIKLGGYRTVKKNHPLTHPIDKRLAGINYGGMSIINKPGILCPIKNENNHYVGWKIRLRGETRNKYRWASSEHWRNPKPELHIQGELPLGVWKHPQPHHPIVGLTEGAVIKPQLIHLKTQLAIIGSGSNFSNLFEIMRLLRQWHTQRIIIFTDAEDDQKLEVMKRWQRLKLSLESEWQVLFAWWNQIETKLDFDETTDKRFEIINWEKFKKLSHIDDPL
jgi:hypothetical protein